MFVNAIVISSHVVGIHVVSADYTISPAVSEGRRSVSLTNCYCPSCDRNIPGSYDLMMSGVSVVRSGQTRTIFIPELFPVSNQPAFGGVNVL